jgi:hypothetical protein
MISVYDASVYNSETNSIACLMFLEQVVQSDVDHRKKGGGIVHLAFQTSRNLLFVYTVASAALEFQESP